MKKVSVLYSILMEMIIITLKEQYIKSQILRIKEMVNFARNAEEVRTLYAEYCKLKIFLINAVPTYNGDLEHINLDPGNCYTYALGLDCPDIFYRKFEQFNPGYIDLNIGFVSNPNIMGDLSRCDDLVYPDKIMTNLLNDFETLQIESFNSDFDCKNIHGGYKIAIFYNNGFICRDFHFIRENKDGSWSEKCGYGGNVEIVEEPQNAPYRLLKVLELRKPKLR